MMLLKTNAPNPISCPRCGYEMAKRKTYCPHCQTRMKAPNRWALGMQILAMFYAGLILIVGISCVAFILLMMGVLNSLRYWQNIQYRVGQFKVVDSNALVIMIGIGLGALVLLGIANQRFKN